VGVSSWGHTVHVVANTVQVGRLISHVCGGLLLVACCAKSSGCGIGVDAQLGVKHTLS
jgi:hypothetical protein